MKKIMMGFLVMLLLGIVGCTSDATTNLITDATTEVTTEAPTEETTTNVITSEVDTTTETTTEVTTEVTTEMPTTMEETTDLPTTMTDMISDVYGIEDQSVIVNHYFDPMFDVYAYSSYGKNITSYIQVIGSVDYGTLGTYDLTYEIDYLDDSYSVERTISVIEGSYSEPTGERPDGFDGSVNLINGSYFTGTGAYINHPMNPQNISDYLLDEAIPSSGWWTSLLVANYGASNGIYTNPLRTSFVNEGLEITFPLDGFVQYWNPEGYQTIAQFPIALKDSFLKSDYLGGGYITKVIDYSDSMVKVAMKNSDLGTDEMIVTLVQGSPYVFVETAHKDGMKLSMDGSAVIEYYDVSGSRITTGLYNGDAMVVKMVQRHSGYNTSPPANVLEPQYEDKYYIINLPTNSTFNISGNVVSMTLGDGNYLSVAAINGLSEAAFYHEYGYTFITDSSIDYEIDYEDSMVYTDYVVSTSQMRDDLQTTPLLALMPHQYKYADVTVTDYSYRTVRGTLKVMAGNYFQTALSFNGVLPGYTLPDNESFSSTQTVSYLEDLVTRTMISDEENFLNDDGPYWNSKALYPLAQGLIIADQLGEEALKQSFINKLRYLLTDWYSYEGPLDDRFLYYNNDWGSTYYSNDDFATGSTLSDHSFTHGYLIYASAVLAMYDDTFVDQYGMVVDVLVNDYMYPYKSEADFAYLRNFDPWAGHSWAHGFGTFAEGNNLESTGEALNSWNAGYLWALINEDQDRMDAAIYGFVTELSAVKEYWFDYDEENWDPAYGDYVDVVGILWGGKHDYATWFGANPTYIYGIQWLPTGEYLTSYALDDFEYNRLSEIFQTYLDAKGGQIGTWYSNMWTIQAIIDPSVALAAFDEDLILNDDYPAELAGSYWMINALDSLGRRYSDVWMGIKVGVASSIYMDDQGDIYALIWNASDDSQSVDFYNSEGLLTTFSVEGNSFTKVKIN